MGEKMNIAVAPPLQVGGTLFTPEQLSTVGKIVGPEAKIEMTPFKQIYVQIPVERRDEIVTSLEQAGLEVYPAGFVSKSLIACNFCKGAEEAGLETARTLNRAIAGIATPTPLKIGYAGCALGTSEPLFKDIGVVKMRHTFDIYVGGEPKGIKVAAAQLLVGGLQEDQLIPTVVRLIDFYKTEAKGKEKFSKFVNRMTLTKLQEIAG
ncbi:NAD(P)/FAD-dependent oxidoreductase [Paenibacillus guangzhouensis]|uniref:nitrite reductase n=1 Tax=Paenibacillus guangzhouensis TaxID=1473112 RepID=UPI001266FC6D|nr:nitrite reductase [Paenibacillus guangzhouensis]